jgi:hypothetical protein
MALFMPYPYTSVFNGSTFGLLHPCRNSSIVSISASTFVLRFGTGRSRYNLQDPRQELGSVEASISSVRLFECTSFFAASSTLVARTLPYD